MRNKKTLSAICTSNCQGTLKQIFTLETENSRSTQKPLSRVHLCEIRTTGTVRETRFKGIIYVPLRAISDLSLITTLNIQQNV